MPVLRKFVGDPTDIPSTLPTMRGVVRFIRFICLQFDKRTPNSPVFDPVAE